MCYSYHQFRTAIGITPLIHPEQTASQPNISVVVGRHTELEAAELATGQSAGGNAGDGSVEAAADLPVVC